MACNTGEPRRIGTQRMRSMIKNPITGQMVMFKDEDSKIMANKPNRMKGIRTKD